jgi:hypothetical protein
MDQPASHGYRARLLKHLQVMGKAEIGMLLE